ncbi:hypothetical protein GCM10027448_02830 [Nocardioides dilutus]
MEPYAEVSAQYLEFAAHAAGESACFVEWSRGVAADPEVLAWVDDLSGLKKQPNIVFAAARWHGVPAPGPYAGLREALLSDDGTIRATIMARSTQTNEVGRLATLLPAFAALVPSGPVALLEAGASAGLNLYPDRWGYAWSTPDGSVTLGPAPHLPCVVTGAAPLPSTLPEVGWRGGVDLNPLDVTDPDAMAWLDNLVWPEDDARRERLRHAVEVARADPPALVRGDLLERLPDLVAEATAYAPVVVFHSAVATYLTREDRVRFSELMRGLVADGACHWVSNEGANVFPEITATAPDGVPDAHHFVLGVDGQMVARTHGHGKYLHWLA